MSDRTWHWFTGASVYSAKVNDKTDLFIRMVWALSGMVFPVTQGSTFGAGSGASASAGTHNGTSVVDFSVTGKSFREIMEFVAWCRRLGAAAWYRPALRGVWPPHIHVVLIQPDGIPQIAINQIRSYQTRHDGLAGNRYDSLNPWVGYFTLADGLKRYYKRYLKLTAPPKKGLFDMTKTAHRETRREVKLDAGKWITLPVNNAGDVSVAAGPTADFNLNVQLRIENLMRGESVIVRAYSVNYSKDKTSRVWESDEVEMVGTGGNTYQQAIFDGSLGKPPKGMSRRLRIEARTYSPGVEGKPVLITRVGTSVRKA